MFRRFLGGSGSVIEQLDLGDVVEEMPELPQYCAQLKQNLDDLYARFEQHASEYFKTRESNVKEVAHILGVIREQGVLGDNIDLLSSNADLRAAVRRGKIETQGRKMTADLAFENYQRSLGVIKDVYENQIRPFLQLPELEATIQDAEQKVQHWAGR